MTLLPDVTTWTWDEFQQTLGCHEMWDPAVRAICSREHIAYNSVRPGFAPSSAVFLLDDSLVLKVYPPDQAESEPIEVCVLTCLEGVSAVPSPRLHTRGILEDRVPWTYVIMEQVPGVPIREVWPQMSPADRQDIARQSADLVQAMHSSLTSSTETALTGLGRGWEQTRDEITEQRREMISMIQSASIPLAKVPLPGTVWDELAEFLEETPVVEPVHRSLTHRDLTEDHLYVRHVDGQWSISGLIDFGDAAVGPSRLDWNDLWFCMFSRDRVTMRTFLQAYHGSSAPDVDLSDCFALTSGWVGFLNWLPVRIPPNHLRTIGTVADLQSALWPEELVAGT